MILHLEFLDPISNEEAIQGIIDKINEIIDVVNSL